MKTFCTAGPIRPEDHYYIPQRLDWASLDSLIDQKSYFLLHAPRQSGKTTVILEYANYLNAQGKYTALYLTTEPAHPARNDFERALYWLLTQLKIEITDQLGARNQGPALSFLEKALQQRPIEESALYAFLNFWAQKNKKPIVIFFDEIDGLVEHTLISLLKQFRTGYTKRPKLFPQSFCLIGVRNLQDYKLKSLSDEEQGVLISPFNIIAESVLLRNFTKQQLSDLYKQHTNETSQIFTEEAIDHAYFLTQGQPWLTNALAYQACFIDVIDRSQPITKEVIEAAKEQIILKNNTHISSLSERLNEPRVCNIIDAIISGESEDVSLDPDDIQYVRDLGLVKLDSWEIANPIYQQIIPRVLTQVLMELMKVDRSWFIESSGKLNMFKLLTGFTDFFRENAEGYQSKTPYLESYPHLLLMAYLQRIINGGGHVHREYGVGKKRVDILVEWKKKERFVIEIKLKSSKKNLNKGLKQIRDYLDLCNGNEAHLIIVDRNSKKSWKERISNEEVIFEDKKIHVWML